MQQKYTGSATYRISSNQRLVLEIDALRQRDALSETVQQNYGITPSAVLAPVRNMRLLMSVATTLVTEDKPDAALPPFFFDPAGTQVRANVTASYRLGRNLNLNMTYSSLRNTDGRTTYDVKAETRAIF